MAARKRSAKPVVEKNKNGVERYASKAAMGMHERREPASTRKREGDAPRKKAARRKGK